MKNNIFSIFILTFIVIQSCNNDDCENSILTVTDLETEYGCENTKYQMDIDLSEDFTIIRSQSNFDNLVMGSCQPTINFSIYDLVIGKKGLSGGNTSIRYQLTEDCNTGNLKLHVTFNQNETTEAPNLTYHALLPKMGDEQKLNVEIEIN